MTDHDRGRRRLETLGQHLLTARGAAAEAAAVARPPLLPSERLVASQPTVFPWLTARADYSDAEATAAALALGNRGPIEFDADGAVSPAILEAFAAMGSRVINHIKCPPSSHSIGVCAQRCIR
jgi:hypothetical protein